jgi:LMBR1 domain-containing protein 1
MILKLLTPFRVGFGISCLCMSFLIIYSMFINNLDRFFNSKCGFSCGYLMDHTPQYFNPLDSILQLLSARHEHFYNIQLFLDTIFFTIVLMYTFICILYGVVKIGLAFISEEFHKIKRRETFPQALSIMAVLVILMMFAFSMQLMSIAPTYLTFGD